MEEQCEVMEILDEEATVVSHTHKSVYGELFFSMINQCFYKLNVINHSLCLPFFKKYNSISHNAFAYQKQNM